MSPPVDNLFDDYAATFLGQIRPKKDAPVDVSGLLDRMRGGSFQQESGGNYQVKPNARTGAVGGFQVMPDNIPSWTLKHYKKQLTPQEFQANPDAQEAVFKGQMGEYLREARKVAPDDDTAIRMGAAGWYGGPKALHRYDDDWRPRPNEPSFKEYTTGVLNKSKKTPEIDLFESYSKAFASEQPDDLLASYQSTFGDVRPLQTPIKESPDTITAQIAAMQDINTPRAAVLTTDPAQNAVFANMDGVLGVPMKEGMLWVDVAKAKKKYKLKTPDEIRHYVEVNPAAMNTLGVRVEDVADTSQGPAVHTIDPATGTELNSSIATTLESQAAQIALDKANHPDSVSQVVDAQDVVNKRLGTPPQPVPGFAEEIIAPDAMPDDEYPGQTVGNLPVQKGVVKRPVVAKRASRGSVPPVKTNIIPNKTYEGDSGTISDAGYDEQGDVINAPKRDIHAIDPKHPENAVADQIDIPDTVKTQDEANKYVIDTLKAKYGDLTLPKDFGFLDKWKPGMGGEISYGDLKKYGVDIEPLIRERVAQTRTETPSPDLTLKQTFTDKDAQELNDTFGPHVGAAISGVVGSGGRVAQTISGLLSFVNDLSPTKGDSMAKALDNKVRPVSVGTNLINYLDEVSKTASGLESQTGAKDEKGEDTFATSVFKLAGGAPGDIGRLILMSRLPGGQITGMALSEAAASRQRGESGTEIAKKAVEGGVLGALFEAAPFIGKGTGNVLSQLANKAESRILQEGLTLGTIGAGTYAISKAAGETDDHAFRSALLNGLMHATNVGMSGKTVHARDAKGNEATVEVSKDGEVKTVAPDTVADVEMLIPEKALKESAKDTEQDGFLVEPSKPKVSKADKEAEIRESTAEMEATLNPVKAPGAHVEGQVAGNVPSVKQSSVKESDLLSNKDTQQTSASGEKTGVAKDLVTNKNIEDRTFIKDHTELKKVSEGERDLAEELIDNNAQITPDGKVVLYHRTTPEQAKQIQETGKMRGDEDGLFFSTVETGQNEGYGKGIVRMEVPLSKLELDDVFGNEAHVRIPLKKAGQIADVKNYITPETLADTQPVKTPDKTGGTSVTGEKSEAVKPLSRLPKRLSGDASTPKGVPNGSTGDAAILTHLLESPTFRDKGLGGFDVPTQRVVMKRVLSMVNDLKVRDAIVKLVPVDVVDVLKGAKSAAKVSLHDKSVLSDSFAVDPNGAVSLRSDAADAIIRAAGTIAKGSADSFDIIRRERNKSTARSAGQESLSPTKRANAREVTKETTSGVGSNPTEGSVQGGITESTKDSSHKEIIPQLTKTEGGKFGDLTPFAKNKIITADRVAEIRQELAKRKGTMNIGIDPTELKLYAELGAAYAEAGFVKFADFSKAMIEDAGEAIKPHLETLYAAVRNEHGFEGMENVGSIKDTFVPSGEIKQSKIGKSIESKAIEKGLTDAFQETAIYDPTTVKEQAELIADILKDPERVKRIIAGEEKTPDRLRDSYFIKGVEDKAMAEGDVKTLSDLAKSKLTSETSVHAQEMRMMAERSPDSVVARLREVTNAREDAAKKRIGKQTVKEAVTKEVDKIQSEIKKTTPKKQDWHSFIQSITCR